MKIIVISASWCMSCLVVNSYFDKVIDDTYEVKKIHLDYDLDKEAIESYKVGNRLPEVLFVNDQQEIVYRSIGEVSKKKLKQLADTYLR